MLKLRSLARICLCVPALSIVACTVPAVDEESNPLAATNVDPDAPIFGTGDGEPKTYPEATESRSLGEGDLTVLGECDLGSGLLQDE